MNLRAFRAVMDSYFDCSHNFVRREAHDGHDLWVHRKGAISATEGELGIIPGSMGSASFHVAGRRSTGRAEVQLARSGPFAQPRRRAAE